MKLIVFGFLFLIAGVAQAQSTEAREVAEATCQAEGGWIDYSCIAGYIASQETEIETLSRSIEALYRRNQELPQFRSGLAMFVASRAAFVEYRRVQCQVLDETFRTNGAGNSWSCQLDLNGPRLAFLRELRRSLLSF